MSPAVRKFMDLESAKCYLEDLKRWLRKLLKCLNVNWVDVYEFLSFCMSLDAKWSWRLKFSKPKVFTPFTSFYASFFTWKLYCIKKWRKFTFCMIHMTFENWGKKLVRWVKNPLICNIHTLGLFCTKYNAKSWRTCEKRLK